MLEVRKLEDKFIYVQPILKGKIVTNPQYINQEVDEYKGNPCIEALPLIFEDSYVVKSLANYPIPDEKEKEFRGNVRYHIIKRIKNYYQPLSNHLKIEHMLSCLIRRSYISRNPNSNQFLQRLRLILEMVNDQESCKEISTFKVCERLSSKLSEIPESSRSSAECSSIIGISGMGKSTAIENLLLMYPQVIIHHKYKEKPLTRTQITWLKIDCPFDGSLKTLCKMFFKALDEVLLTTDYDKRYGNKKNSTATMMIYMAHLSCLHSIGVLVIDEMQHLINPKNSPDETLNFLVTLVNTIGVSLIQIGTPKITKVLEMGLREVRRAEEAGSIIWDRMRKDEEWNFFIENLWECQWLRNFTPLDEELNNAMYEETQGITAVAISLFILVQAEAIFSEKEKITTRLIHNVARNDLKLTQKIINAIRNNREGELAMYEDISIIVEELLNDKIKKENNRKRIEEISTQHKESIKNKRSNLKEQIITEILSLGLFLNLDYGKIKNLVELGMKDEPSLDDIPRIKKNIMKAAILEEERINKDKEQRRKDMNEKPNYSHQDLRYLFDKATKDNIHIYDILSESNYIKNPSEEFYI